MRRKHIVVCTLIFAGLVSSSAAAQANIERARELFAEGVAFTHAEEWEQAADRFERTLAIRQSPQVRYNLALAYLHLNRLVEAAGVTRHVLTDSESPGRVRRDARRLLREINPRIAQLTVTVSGNTEGVTYRIDERDILADDVAEGEFNVDPGSHTFFVRRGDNDVVSEPFTVADGAHHSLAVEVPEPVAAVAEPLPEVEVPIDDDPIETPSGSIADDPVFWAVLIGALAAVAVGAIVIGVVLAGEPGQPLSGNLDPGFIEIMP